MILNGIDTTALAAFSEELAAAPEAGAMTVRVRTRWEHSSTTTHHPQEG